MSSLRSPLQTHDSMSYWLYWLSVGPLDGVHLSTGMTSYFTEAHPLVLALEQQPEMKNGFNVAFLG
jgi:hypothetical protein